MMTFLIRIKGVLFNMKIRSKATVISTAALMMSVYYFEKIKMIDVKIESESNKFELRLSK